MNRQHVRPLPRNWWLRKRTYFTFMVRELTSVFVAGYAVFLLVLLWRADDPSSFSGVFDALDSSWSLVIHVILLAVVLFHTVTWINLTPKVLVLFRDDEQISPTLIAASNYVAWLVLSGLVAWLALL
jgi:fumarate reductase subunit C